MARPELIVRVCEKLRAIGVPLGSSVRDVERLSMDLARDRHNPYILAIVVLAAMSFAAKRWFKWRHKVSMRILRRPGSRAIGRLYA